MQDTWSIIQTSFFHIFETGYVLPVLILSFLFLFITEKKREIRYFLLGGTLLFTFLYFCPLSGFIFVKMIGDNVYDRVFWLIPTVLLIAYAFSKIINHFKGIRAFILFLYFSFSITLFGKDLTTNGLMIPVNNPYKIWDDVAEILDYIPDNSHLFTSTSMAAYVRIYNPTLTLANTRWGYSLNDHFSEESLDEEYIDSKLESYNADYLILYIHDSDKLYDILTNRGYSRIVEKPEWVIYENMEK